MSKTNRKYRDSLFVDLINKARKAGYKDYITVAINQAKQMGLMVDYLSRKSKEVSNMIFGEYNYERDIKVQREEAYEDGLEAGIEQGIEQGAYQTKLETARKLIARGDSPEDVAQLIGLSLLEVQDLMTVQN